MTGRNIYPYPFVVIHDGGTALAQQQFVYFINVGGAILLSLLLHSHINAHIYTESRRTHI